MARTNRLARNDVQLHCPELLHEVIRRPHNAAVFGHARKSEGLPERLLDVRVGYRIVVVRAHALLREVDECLKTLLYPMLMSRAIVVLLEGFYLAYTPPA